MHSIQRMTQTYQIRYHLHDAMLDIGILNGVKAHKATGPDEVLSRLLKEAADQFAIHSPCRMANSKRNPNLQEGYPAF